MLLIFFQRFGIIVLYFLVHLLYLFYFLHTGIISVKNILNLERTFLQVLPTQIEWHISDEKLLPDQAEI